MRSFGREGRSLASVDPFGRISLSLLAGLLLLFLATGCDLAETPFVRETGNAGSAFSAASTLLSYVHTHRVSRAYASSGFANFQSELSGLDQELPKLSGAPSGATIRHLLDLYAPAMRVINNPCLDDGCSWQDQIMNLKNASKGFLEASGQ